MGDELLSDLDPEQRLAVTADAYPLCVLAGAGSGKTRVLTRRIAWRVATGSASARHALALTFTRKAAGELRTRLHALQIRDAVAAGTFHGIAYAQLRRRWADEGRHPPAVWTRKATVLSRLVPAQVARDRNALADVAAEIEWAKARLVDPGLYADEAVAGARTPPVPLGQMAEIYRLYEAEKARRGALDLDDLLIHCARAMDEDAAFAAAQRWAFRHVFVDEFQDVNPAQGHLLDCWLGDRLDLCVVGDPNQAIYSWNGADPSRIQGFADRYPTATVVRLDRNYRSTPEVVTLAGAVIRRRPEAVHCTRRRGPVPSLTSYPDDWAEARAIAARLRRARRPNGPWSDLAVLTRTNAQLVLIQRALAAAQIPHRLVGGGAFVEHPAVRSHLGNLHGGRQELAAWLADLENATLGGSEGGWLEPRLDEGEPQAGATGPEAAGGAEEAVAHRLTLVRLAREYRSIDPDATADGFAEWLTLALRSEAESAGGDGVCLTTFHRSKGLEWEVVFLAGLEHGYVPIGHATTPAKLSEERRLVYVAMTRSREHLHLSWAAKRTFGTRALPRRRSPYLDVVEAALGAMAEGGDPRALARAVARERERLRGSGREGTRRLRPAERLASLADPEVLDSLRSWRASTARASGVPAFVILHDSTLAALAEARPSTHDELMALPGLGPVKAARYGDQILDLLRRPA